MPDWAVIVPAVRSVFVSGSLCDATPAMSHPSPQPYDIVGDIHGELGALERLLETLGYREQGNSLAHPEGRKLLFLGDFIDRGPDSRGVLRLVRRLVDSGTALAILGNHEFNFVAYMSLGDRGAPLRSHSEGHARQVAETLRSFEGNENEIDEWVEWMKGLPFFLDLGGLRAVHAAWVPGDIGFLDGKSLHDRGFLREANFRNSDAWHAIGRVVKGVELLMPAGRSFRDTNGIERHHMRVRWWGGMVGCSWQDIAFPARPGLPEGLAELGELAEILDYSENEPPVFFGHYKRIGEPPGLQAPNVACLDYGLGHGGPATTYRWSGERTLDARKIVQVL